MAAKPRKKLGMHDEKFVRDLLIRGEAAKPQPDGKLPAGATHEIIEKEPATGQNTQSLPAVRRRRFSTF